MYTKIILVIILSIMFIGCARSEISVKPTDSSENLAFKIEYGDVLGLLGAYFWVEDTREPLWGVNLDYFHEKSLIYGEVPADFVQKNGGTARGKQLYPEEGNAENVPSNKRIALCLTYAYNSFISGRSSRRQYFTFLVDENLEIVDFKESGIVIKEIPEFRLGN